MKYEAKCHCGEIAFSVEGELDRAVACNCSICAQSGYLHWMVDPAQVQLKTPLEKATLYVWGPGQARHWFCPKCGVAVLRIPRGMPNRYTVNVRCLEGVDVESIPTEHFDGRNKLKV